MVEDNGNAVNLSIVRIYTKDISFESPSSPAIFEKGFQPEIKMNVSNKSTLIDKDIYEVVLQINVEAKVKDSENPAFIIEVEQAGLFAVAPTDSAVLSQILGVFCPTTLFPYVRSVIDNLLVVGGLPPIMLNPINFEHIWRQRHAGAGSR